jgi:ABC-type glycerol-3-phosphate transport system permease component
MNMSLQNNIELCGVPPHFYPPQPTLDNFRSVPFGERGLMKFYEAVFDTLSVAGITMVVCVIVGSITGYALARLGFKQ